jgi:hypothetical protein
MHTGVICGALVRHRHQLDGKTRTATDFLTNILCHSHPQELVNELRIIYIQPMLGTSMFDLELNVVPVGRMLEIKA